MPIGCSELVFVNRAGEVSGSDAGRVPMARKTQPTPAQMERAAALFAMTGRQQFSTGGSKEGRSGDAGVATSSSLAASSNAVTVASTAMDANAPTPQGGSTPVAGPATETAGLHSSTAVTELLMAGSFSATAGTDEAVVAATLGVGTEHVEVLAASKHSQGSGGPPNGAEQLAAVAFERTRHDYIATQLGKRKSAAQNLGPQASSSSSSSSSSGKAAATGGANRQSPPSPGLATAMGSHFGVPTQDSIKACESLACLLA